MGVRRFERDPNERDNYVMGYEVEDAPVKGNWE